MFKSKVYVNGNYFVIISPDDTKTYRSIRLEDKVFKASFPDSIDLKITNSCPFGCPYCHEESVPGGKSFDVDRTIKILDTLPKVGIELAIGGGDVLDCYEDLDKLLTWCVDNNFLPRLTINIRDFKNKSNHWKIQKLSYKTDNLRIGISIESVGALDLIPDNLLYMRSVYHIIVGIFPYKELERLVSNLNVCKVLILGFKQWGRAREDEIKDLPEWKQEIHRLIYKGRNDSNIRAVLGFDNLAIEQLDIRSTLTETEWSSSYMGPEFSHSMYIDAVKEEYAPTSRSPQRTSWNDIKLLDYFKTRRNND